MQVFLTVFFSCLPLALALPQPHPSDAPTTTSLHSPVQSFTLSNITYESHLTYSTPAHVASSYATLTFNLTDSRAYKASCSAFDSGGIASWFNYPQNFTCTRLTGEYLSGDGSFMYVGYSLQVNETWNADGYKYLAVSDTINLPSKGFQCKTTSWQNPDWSWPDHPGIYFTSDTKCDPLSIVITPSVSRVG